MKSLLQSPVLAAFILSTGLIISAVIVSRPNPLPPPMSSAVAANPEQSLSEETIKTQFITQMKEQIGPIPYKVMNKQRILKDVVIDRFQMSPKRNRVDIDYRIEWNPGPMVTETHMSLELDKYGRFDSGNYHGFEERDNKIIRVTIP